MRRPQGNDLKLGTSADGVSLTLSRMTEAATSTSPERRARESRIHTKLHPAGHRQLAEEQVSNCLSRSPRTNLRRHCFVADVEAAVSSKNLPILLIDPRQDSIVGYNVLRKREAETAVVVGNFIEAMAHAFRQGDTVQTPQFAEVGANIFWVLYELQLTLAEAVYLTDFDSKQLRLAMTAEIAKHEVRRDWRNYNRLSATAFDERVGSTVRRLRAFVGHERIKWMFGQSEASLDWRSVLDDGCIVLCNLSREKGRLDEECQRVLGSTMLHDLWLAACERGKKDQIPCYVYLDEFQRFVRQRWRKVSQRHPASGCTSP